MPRETFILSLSHSTDSGDGKSLGKVRREDGLNVLLCFGTEWGGQKNKFNCYCISFPRPTGGTFLIAMIFLKCYQTLQHC